MLDLPVGTVERWIRQGRIPIRKSGAYCYFRKAVLEKWAETHNLTFSKTQNQENPVRNELPTLLAAMENGGVLHGIPGNQVEAVLEAIVARNRFVGEAVKPVLLSRLLERERLTSTGIGNGVAIPHPRAPLQEGLSQAAISTCFLEKPVDFHAIDNKPVFVVFLLISTSVKIHLHLLSRLSFCVRDPSFVSFLETRPDRLQFMETIAFLEKSGS